MRRAILLILLLLIPSAWAEESQDWTVEVEDPFGNPITNCNVTLSDPWTGGVMNEPSGAMYQPSANCEGYAVMWHPPIPTSQTTVVLDAYPLIEDLFTVEGAHTIQVLGSTWESAVVDGPVKAPSGVSVLVIGEGGSETRYSQNQIMIPNATISYNLSGNYSEDFSVIAYNTGSGQAVEWVNQNLTVGEYGGGWIARIMANGIPKGESIWPPTVEWINSQLNHSITAGSANINFTSSLIPNENITGHWNVNHVFSDGLGLPFIPGVKAGIASQVDRYLNGDVSQLESLLETMTYNNGKEALCCLIDDGPVMFTSFEIDAEIDLSSGTWGWSEVGTFTAARSNIDMLRLEIPFQNDLRQTTPLTITTDGEWQYLSSPLSEWINGSTSNFTLDRDESSISGYYTITLGPNSAPTVAMAEVYALPWDNQSYDFEAVIEDAPLSVHDCEWNISGSSQNLAVNLSALTIDSIIPVSVTCTDEGGLSDSWDGSYILDGRTPSINESNEIKIVEPGFFQWELMVEDDHDEDLLVYWTSNKSLDWWYTGDNLQTTFNVDSNLNSINDNLSERHKARNQVEYWLSANVSDDVGHSVSGNWTIRLSDISSPSILGTLERHIDGDEWVFSDTVFSPEDRIRINLTETFDDHSSIDKINFTIEITDKIYSGISWSEAQYWEVPSLGTGYHELTVKAYDEVGNLATTKVAIAISPPNTKDLEIIDITSASVETEPGMNEFWVTVQNNGAGTTEFILCSNDRCVDSIVGPSSFSQNATTIVYIKADLDWFETFSVEISYQDDNNETVVKQKTSDFNSGFGLELLELIGITVVIAIAIAWFRTRNEPRF